MRNVALRLSALLFLALSSPLGAQAGAAGSADLTPGLRIEVREDRYALDHASLGAAVEALNEMRLEGADGPPSQGLTVYDLSPRWLYQRVGDRCVVRAVELTVRVRVTLPEWSGLERASPAERTRWERLLSRITEHEYEHRDITVEVASELFGRLRFLSAGSCNRLERAADAAVATAEEELTRRHADLDAAVGREELTGS